MSKILPLNDDNKEKLGIPGYGDMYVYDSGKYDFSYTSIYCTSCDDLDIICRPGDLKYLLDSELEHIRCPKCGGGMETLRLSIRLDHLVAALNQIYRNKGKTESGLYKENKEEDSYD